MKNHKTSSIGIVAIKCFAEKPTAITTTKIRQEQRMSMKIKKETKEKKTKIKYRMILKKYKSH